MKYIESYKERDMVNDIYLCKKKQSALTKNGKPYETIVLQDKTGTLEAKIWEPGSVGIDDYEELDYIEVRGDITSFMGNLQLNVKRLRRAQEGEYVPSDYLPCSQENVSDMYQELLGYIETIESSFLKKLLQAFFVEDQEFAKLFQSHSAAKSVHHGFVGGLLEHTLNVTKVCEFYAKQYPILNRDLLLTAAMFHDIGKTKELSGFPSNDYTDEGQLLGHIVMGVQMIGEKAVLLGDVPEVKLRELQHCIIAHHGELEYGSPKKPALVEAIALNMADNIDAKMETMKELFAGVEENDYNWQGYQRLFESNIRRTSKDEV